MSKDKTLLSWVDSLGKAVGLISSFSLLCSIAYDWGFLYALGLSFSDIPTSLADHVRSTLNWLPLAFATVSVVFIFELFTMRIEQGMTEEEIIESSPNPKFTRKFRNSPTILIATIAILILISYLLFGRPFFGGLSFSLIILWFCFSYFVNKHPRILQRRSSALRFVIHWLPPVIIFMVFLGYNGAISIQNKSNLAHKVYLKDSSSEPINVNLIRLFDKGILIKAQKEDSIVFVGWDSVSKIEASYKKDPFKGILCEWFNVFCFPDDKMK